MIQDEKLDFVFNNQEELLSKTVLVLKSIYVHTFYKMSSLNNLDITYH